MSGRVRPASIFAVAVACTAVGVLLVVTPDDRPRPAGPVTSTAAWPNAQRATVSGSLADGTTFVPGHFLDARTAVGTAADPGGRAQRLVVRQLDGTYQQLRSLPLDRGPAYGSFASAGGKLVWVESTVDLPPRIWATDLTDPASSARQLTADTGAAVFIGSQYDLVIHDRRVHWSVVPDGADHTEIRSVPLSGGPVSVRKERGRWNLSAWPWLTDGTDRTSVARLRNPVSGRDVEIDTGTGLELLTCGPAWCRVTVRQGGDSSRLDLMRHDGSQRTTMAGAGAGAVGPDVAVLDRFELLFAAPAGAGPDDRTALLVYDIAAARTVEVSPAVDGAFSRAGMLWWSTGDGDSLVWQTLDLRTV